MRGMCVSLPVISMCVHSLIGMPKAHKLRLIYIRNLYNITPMIIRKYEKINIYQ